MANTWWLPPYVGEQSTQAHRFPAVILFNDVSGFTPMSEALGKQGSRGTELLTGILNNYFSPIIDIIHAHGGLIAQFVGDALTIIFPVEDSPQHAVHHATQCAIMMQTTMARYQAINTPAGDYQLSMKSGIAMGKVLSLTVGNGAQLPILAGEALVHSAAAEQLATDGQTLLHKSVWDALPPAQTAPVNDDFSRLELLTTPTLPPVDTTPEPQKQVAIRMLHPILRDRLNRGQTAFINEHRQVTVLFVQFSGFDYDNDPQVDEKLRSYFEKVLAVVDHYEGYLNKIDVGDKGSKYVVIFGAPVTHPESQERALRCALELRQIEDVPVQIGLNTGFAFCGLIGSEKRREYTVIGENINLAARLMQQAKPGQILVHQNTYQYTHGQFHFEEIAPFELKGFSEAITAYNLISFKGVTSIYQQPIYTHPMIGRLKELENAAELLANLSENKGHVLAITGEAGMGKSRLKAEVIRAATGILGVPGYVGECQSYGTKVRYLVWHDIWRGFFGVTSTDQLDHLKQQLADVDPRFAERMPLLGVALNMTIPDNATTEVMDARARKSMLESILIGCLRKRAEEKPLFLVLEDAHWMDSLSFDLLQAIMRNIVDIPVLILLVYRPDDGNFQVERLQAIGNFTVLNLQPFTEEETGELLAQKVDTETSANLVKIIQERTQGNPFYIDEIINLMLDQNIDVQQTKEFSVFKLPASLHDLINSRIDQLGEAERITLKIASVLGRIIHNDWLEAMHPLQNKVIIQAHVSTLTRRNFLVPLDTQSPSIEFRHIATQEVAYESLTVATRAGLHEKIARYLESRYADQINDYLELLIHHYTHGANEAKQIEYLRKAADVNRDSYANTAAIDYYERLLTLLPDDQTREIHVQVGKIYELTGQWEKAEAHFRQALEKAGGDLDAQGEAENELGRLMTTRGRYAEAEAMLTAAETHFEAANDKVGMARARTNRANIFLHQRQPEAALDEFAEAQAMADDELQSLILGNMGIAHGMLGNFDIALTYFEKQLETARQIHNKRRESFAIGNLGTIYSMTGKPMQALLYYHEQLLASMAIGERQHAQIALYNIGDLYAEFGNDDQARRCLLEHLKLNAELGLETPLQEGLFALGNILKRQKQFTLAERAYQLALQIEETAAILTAYADLQLQQRQYVAALSTIEKARAQAPNTDEAFHLDLMEVLVQFRNGQQSAEEAVVKYNQMLTAALSDQQKADLYYHLWLVDHSKFAYRANAESLYKRLYEEAPSPIYPIRYRQMTGQSLEQPVKLPTLSLGIQDEPDVARVLNRITKLIER